MTIPQDAITACRGSFIVRKTKHYCSFRTTGGLVIPVDDEADLVERKFDIGIVVSIGSEVKEVKVGQVCVYQRNAAMRVPNGFEKPFMYKLEESPIAILCLLPLDPNYVGDTDELVNPPAIVKLAPAPAPVDVVEAPVASGTRLIGIEAVNQILAAPPVVEVRVDPVPPSDPAV